MLFKYTAVDKSGNEITDTIEALNISSAKDLIKARELYLVDIKEEKTKTSAKFSKAKKNISRQFYLTGSKITEKDYSVFVRQLATLINSGLTIVRSINILAKQQKNKMFQKMLNNIGQDIESGSTFSDALIKYPKVFTRLFVSMVRAGEAGGVLGLILERLADFSEQSRVLKSRIKSAFVYPAVVVVMSILVVSVLLVVVVPKFKEVFNDVGAELPLPTVALLKISSFFQYYWWLLFIFALAAFSLYKFLLKNKGIRFGIDKLKLKAPVYGEIIEKINIIRFSRTLGTLVASEVPILKALDIVKETSTNLCYEKTIEDLSATIKEGEAVSALLSKTEIFPPVVVNMIEVGEETGTLDKMLLKAASIYEQELDLLVTSLTKLLEPLLIVIMAVVVAYIVISMFMPLVSLMSTLSA